MADKKQADLRGTAADDQRIRQCTCSHPFQDTEYGYGMRLHTWGPRRDAGGSYMCTVCGQTRKPGA